VVDCRSKGESYTVLRRNKECSRDSETFSCTLWYKVGSLQSRQFTDIANNVKLMVLCWRRSGRVPPVSVHLQSCDEGKCSFARDCEAKRWSHRTCSSLGTIFKPMRIISVPDVKWFCNKKKICYVYNQWYDISCATLYLVVTLYCYAQVTGRFLVVFFFFFFFWNAKSVIC